MPEIPPKLEETLELLDLVPDRAERIQLLIDIADRFEEVPPRIARRPFSPDHLVPACESQAYLWGEERPDGTLDFHFAVDNPQGISAKSLAVILDEGLSGSPLEQVAAVPQDVVYRVFGRELSMGKSMGLMGMVAMVAAMARQRLSADTAASAGTAASSSASTAASSASTAASSASSTAASSSASAPATAPAAPAAGDADIPARRG